MDRHEVAHRFCNKDFGRDGHLSAGNVSVRGRNYYSYSTVFGQWVDMKKNVCLVYDGSTSPSSSKHQICGGYFPGDTHVFPYDDLHLSSYCYGYHGCDLLGYSDKFDWNDRMRLLDYWIDCQFSVFHAIYVGNSKNLEKVSFKNWDYVEELCSLYKDTSVNKWLKGVSRIPKDRIKKAKIMARLLKDGERNVQVITDAMFGKGTYQKYIDYCERFRKADRKKAQMEWLCDRLLLMSPYEKCCGTKRVNLGLSANQIRKLTAKQRNDIHFNNLMVLEYRSKESERDELYLRRKRNAYKWIVGYEPVFKCSWNTSYKDVNKVRNRFTGEEYETTSCFDLPSFLGWKVDFNFDRFRQSKDKEKWIQDFYAECKRHNNNLLALRKLQEIGANKHEKKRKYDDDRYIADEYLRENTDDKTYALCVAYINAVDKHYADEEARERAEAIRRQREEEERRLEMEFQEKIRNEQIEACVKEGAEGCRNLWRMHLMSIYDAKVKFDETCVANDNAFYNGGNVLMRFGMKKDIVETSMRIKIDIPTCKKLWKLINIWHKDHSKFRETKVDTHYSGVYWIESYENDILTAGCHRIAYSEMERMYNQIIEEEKTA